LPNERNDTDNGFLESFAESADASMQSKHSGIAKVMATIGYQCVFVYHFWGQYTENAKRFCL
jgi:hypothetical protein